MNLKLLRRLATHAFVVAVAVAATMTSGAPAQSLGDVARKEESRRRAVSGGKTYTNDDLRGAPAPAASSPAQPSTATPAAGAAPADAATNDKASKADAVKPDAKGEAKPAAGDGKTADAGKAGAKPAPDPKQDEAAWRKRRQTAQESLDRAKTFADALQSRINGLTADFSARDDPAQRNAVAADRQKALTELERVKKEIQQHTQALNDLQEEARKSGVPAGWLR